MHTFVKISCLYINAIDALNLKLYIHFWSYFNSFSVVVVLLEREKATARVFGVHV